MALGTSRELGARLLGIGVVGRPLSAGTGHDRYLPSCVQLQSFRFALVKFRRAKRRKDDAEWLTAHPGLTMPTCVAILRNLLSPAATASRLRMCVAGRENGCESRLVMSPSRSLRFLQLSEAVLGPSTSAIARARLTFGLVG